MDRRKFPGGPDDMLPMGMPEQPPAQHSGPRKEYNATTQRSFVDIPNLVPFDPNPLVEVTHEDVARIRTVDLTKILYSEGKRSVDRVALNAAEYGRIAIHLPTLLDRAEAPASKKYEFANEVIRKEHELKRRQDVVKDMGPRHKEILEGLDAEIENIATLRTYARHPHLRRAGDAKTRIMAAQAWRSVDNMLQVIGDKANWSADERAGAREAMLRGLFTGPSKIRVAEWKRVLPLVYDYARRKRYVFAQRYDEIETAGAKITAELTEYLDQYGYTS